MGTDYLSTLNMLKVDKLWLIDVAEKVTNLKMYPFFIAAHSIGVCLELKDEINSSDDMFTRRHPLTCWMSTMLCIFAGSILSNFLMGEPVLTPFKSHDHLLISSIIWYLIFYSPFDAIYHLFKFFPIKITLLAMKEVYRCKKVYEGVSIASKIYPNSFLIIIIIGTVKGVGSLMLRNFERLLRGIWVPNTNEILQPTPSTKLCLIASIIFALQKYRLITVPIPLVYFGVVAFMVYFRISVLISGIQDPFLPLENVFCTIFMGGIWDALAKARHTKKENVNGSGVANEEEEPKPDKVEKDKKKD